MKNIIPNSYSEIDQKKSDIISSYLKQKSSITDLETLESQRLLQSNLNNKLQSYDSNRKLRNNNSIQMPSKHPQYASNESLSK